MAGRRALGRRTCVQFARSWGASLRTETRRSPLRTAHRSVASHSVSELPVLAARCLPAVSLYFPGVLAMRFSRTLSLVLAVAAPTAAAFQGQILEVSSNSLTTYLPSASTAVQGVRPLAIQRGVGLDGSIRAGASQRWALAGNPFEHAWRGHLSEGGVRLDTGASPRRTSTSRCLRACPGSSAAPTTPCRRTPGRRIRIALDRKASTGSRTRSPRSSYTTTSTTRRTRSTSSTVPTATSSSCGPARPPRSTRGGTE